MTQLGMDVDAVEKTSKELKAKANDIKSLISSIDSSVKKLSSTWEGKDAQTFVNDWWPKHKKNLTSVANDVEGLGTSAWNNAQEQRQVSGTTGGGTSSQAGHSGTPAAHSATQSGSNTGGGQTSAPAQGGLGVEPQSGGRDAYINQVGQPDDQLDGMGAFRGECTSWAAFRRKELGLEWRKDPSLGTGNGGEMAGRMGGTATTPPSLGAIVSDPGDGHVMIIEQIYPDGSFRVSEMNVVPVNPADRIAGNPYSPKLGEVRTDRIWHPNADGTYTYTSDGTGYATQKKRLVIAP